MGLDSYIYQVEPAAAPDEHAVELKYWRRNHELHRWMDHLYRSQGGVGEFNCMYLALNQQHMNQLKRHVCMQFLMGNEQQDYHQMFQDVDLSLAQGKHIYYYSSW